jgi:hypothetical protein
VDSEFVENFSYKAVSVIMINDQSEVTVERYTFQRNLSIHANGVIAVYFGKLNLIGDENRFINNHGDIDAHIQVQHGGEVSVAILRHFSLHQWAPWICVATSLFRAS